MNWAINYSVQRLKNVTVAFSQCLFPVTKCKWRVIALEISTQQMGIAYMDLIIPEYKNEEGRYNSDDLGNATQENYED